MSATILEHVRNHLHPDGAGLLPGGSALPDETEADGPVWAAGALDGVMGHHAGTSDVDDEVARVIGLLRGAVGSWRTQRAQKELYDAVTTMSVHSLADGLLGRSEELGDPATYVPLSRWLVREGRHREPVKLGIVLQGLAAAPEDLDVLRVLARHDEFTLYCAVALLGYAEDPEDELWAVARGVTGWGRVDAVERLAGTQRPEIQQWLLRGGFRNEVMTEYTAHVAATSGRLREALEGPVDDELLDCAVELLRALVAGGPAKDLSDYDDGPPVVLRVLAEVARHPTVARALLAADLVDLADPLRPDPLPEHWPEDVRAEVRERAAAVLTAPALRAGVVDGLEAEDAATFFEARAIAPHVGVDVVPALLRRMAAGADSRTWFDARLAVDAGRIAEVLTVADATFDRATYGGGAADLSPFGPDYERWMSFEFLLAALAGCPGRGWSHVATGLECPAVRPRAAAARTLAAWGRAAWPADGVEVVEAAAAAEPADFVRDLLARALAGEPPEWA